MTSSHLRSTGQYIKDLSFEVPHAPNIYLLQPSKEPNVNVKINVETVEMTLKSKENDDIISKNDSKLFEVTLNIIVQTTMDETVMFICELKYCGMFEVTKISLLNEENIKRLLLIKSAALLFPFARQIICNIALSGGFPPLLLDNIDFSDMYEKHEGEKS